MAFTTGQISPFGKAAARIGPRMTMLFLSAVLFGLCSFLVESEAARRLLWLVSATIGFATLWLGLSRLVPGRSHLAARGARLLEADPVPVILTGPHGRLLYANPAARQCFPADQHTTLAATMAQVLAGRDRMLRRLESEARTRGAASEDVVTEAGRLRLAVHRCGRAHLLWRVETDGASRLAESNPDLVPMLTVGRNDGILFMNRAARELIGERVRTLDRVCDVLPLRPGQTQPIKTRDGPIQCLVAERECMAGRREVYLLPGAGGTQAQAVDGWAFFDELPVALLKLDREGALELSNRPARELLGVKDTTGLMFGDVLEGLGRALRDWIEDAAIERGTRHSEFLRVRRDDREVFVQVRLKRAFDKGRLVLIGVLSDATELKSLEAQFVQSQKMQAIGQLAGGVAHDFNNLLTAISGHCDLLLLRHDQGDDDYGDLMQISQNANRAAALVGQLLAYSRKQTLRPEIIDLRDVLSDLAHLMNRLVGEKVSLVLSHDPTLSPIRADRQQLEQVLMNLVVNARDAMPDGGDIRIETRNLVMETAMQHDRATVSPGRYVAVDVIDRGEGIAPEKLQKVFEPFYTTKRPGEGTGLGLSTAYGIVKQTGGFIFAHSRPGDGARFELLFPAFDGDPDPPTISEVPSPDDAPAGTGVVLLVEDEAPVRAFASRALQLRGFAVLEAASGEDALDILGDGSLQVDVFVTDVVMPGLDGPGWVRRAREKRPDVRIVFMSGYAEETFDDAQGRIPNSVFLAKPFSLDELTETVQRQLR